MFNCGRCGEPSRRGQPVVTETREKTYTVEVPLPGRAGMEGKTRTVVVGQGRETVREERWCLECIDEERKEAADA
jgi:hypothetical protein